MRTPEVDYKKLYEESQQRLSRAEALAETHRRDAARYKQAKAQAEQAKTQAEQVKVRLEQEHAQLEQEKMQLSREKAQAEQELQTVRQAHELTLQELDKLRRMLFGISSDNRTRRTPAEQLTMFTLGADEAVKQSVETELEKALKEGEKESGPTARKGRKPVRMIFPDHLEREEVIIDPKGDLSAYRVIGEEVTELLAIDPARFKVKRIVRRKWALKDNRDISRKGVLIAPIPPRTVKRGLFDESLLAHLVISKFQDHLPLYRQGQMFERGGGIKIPQNTLSGNVAAVCRELGPIYRAIKRQALGSKYLQVDETRNRVLQSGKKGACHQGFFWVYHAPGDGIVFFEYGHGRDHRYPEETLKSFRGVLQCDGYAVYQKLFKGSKRVHLTHCMAHIRRKFDEAAGYDLQRARYAVDKIGELYGIEREIREADPALNEVAIVNLRMERAAPIMNELKAWMLAEQPRVLPQSPIGKAIAYALPLWDSMGHYLLHGHLQVDNNAIENALRPVPLGRKNFLFHGTEETAQHAAIAYSLFATCKKHQVNVQDWLTDVLRKINDPDYEGKYSDLMPHRWKVQQTL